MYNINIGNTGRNLVLYTTMLATGISGLVGCGGAPQHPGASEPKPPEPIRVQGTIDQITRDGSAYKFRVDVDQTQPVPVGHIPVDFGDTVFVNLPIYNDATRQSLDECAEGDTILEYVSCEGAFMLRPKSIEETANPRDPKSASEYEPLQHQVMVNKESKVGVWGKKATEKGKELKDKWFGDGKEEK